MTPLRPRRGGRLDRQHRGRPAGPEPRRPPGHGQPAARAGGPHRIGRAHRQRRLARAAPRPRSRRPAPAPAARRRAPPRLAHAQPAPPRPPGRARGHRHAVDAVPVPVPVQRRPARQRRRRRRPDDALLRRLQRRHGGCGAAPAGRRHGAGAPPVRDRGDDPRAAAFARRWRGPDVLAGARAESQPGDHGRVRRATPSEPPPIEGPGVRAIEGLLGPGLHRRGPTPSAAASRVAGEPAGPAVPITPSSRSISTKARTTRGSNFRPLWRSISATACSTGHAGL